MKDKPLSQYRGIHIFGRAYRIMFEKDPHPPGSVDRALLENMILFCEETFSFLYNEYTPLEVFYMKGERPLLEKYVNELSTRTEEEIIKGIASFTSGLKNKIKDNHIDSIILGGKEEEIIERGSFWCTDVARVACALFQVAGFPARIVYLINPNKTYSGHAIVEVYRVRWGAVDPLTAVVYSYPGGNPASVWELMHKPDVILYNSKGEETPYTTPEQFKMEAISNYFICEEEKYDYSTGKINKYYRSILYMADRGWPGGLRWLHGKDRI